MAAYKDQDITSRGIVVCLLHLPANAVVRTGADSNSTDNCCIAVVRGVLQLIMHDAIYEARPHNVYFLPKDTLLRAECDGAKLWKLCYTQRYPGQSLPDETLSLPQGGFHVYSFENDPAHFKVLRRLMQLLHTYSAAPATPKTALLCKFAFYLLLNYLADHLPVSPISVKSSHRQREQTTIKFLQLLAQHVTGHHDVNFYAGQLFMTRGNLTRIIKETTGTTPKLLIEQALTAAAKIALDTSTASVYQIAEQLNFNSSPAFISFFRQHTGMTPNDYRNRNKT